MEFLIRNNMKKSLQILVAVIICQAAGLIGAFFTMPAIDTWYDTLIKPEFNPPSWVFGPVWTMLYTFMGIAVYLIWKSEKSKLRTVALTLFATQLALNSLWSILFFGMQNPGLAFGEILILWAAIVATIVSFVRIDRGATYLMIPYLLWTSFAVILNGALFALN